MDGGQGKALASGKAAPSVAALDKRLNLRRRAREAGARGEPGEEATELCAVELDILQAVAGERRRIDLARLEAKAEAERRLRALNPAPEDFAAPAFDARLSLRQLSGRLAHDWSEAARRAAEARADLHAFKQEHALRRAAIYPRSSLMQAGLLACATLFEAMFSAALIAENKSILQAAILAVGLSSANVTLGFLGGFLGLRYLQHVRPLVRIAGVAGFGALTFLAVTLNLFAAEYRDRAAAGAPDQGSDASFHLWSLLRLETPEAIILLMLGGGVWVFAALKGYSGFDDPYPDFGKMSRAAERAAEVLSDFRAEAHVELEAPLDQARGALNQRLERMGAAFEAMNKAFNSAALEMERLDAQARALDEAAQDAVHLFRQENLAARTIPAPAYFSTPPPAIGPALDALAVCAAMIDAARARLKVGHADAAEARNGLQAEFDAVTKALDAAPAP